RAWTYGCPCGPAVVRLRLRTVASRRPRSRRYSQYRRSLRPCASWFAAAQDITGIRTNRLDSRPAMGWVTTTDIDALWGPATPQFAYQVAERLEALIADLPPGDPVRRHGELRLAELDQLGHDTSKGNETGH